jgi:hypothetical protein
MHILVCTYASLPLFTVISLIKLGSRRTVKYWDLFSFDLTFARSKITSVRWVIEHYGGFREFAQNFVAPSVHF